MATAVIHSAPAAMLRGLDVGVDVASLIAGIRERERRKDALTRQLAELDRPRIRPLAPATAHELLQKKLIE